MADPKLGESVAAAHRFLTAIHNQLAQLLTALDALMSEHGWAPTNPNVSSRVGVGLTSELWMPNYLYRFYFPTGDKTASKRFVGVLTFFTPPEGWTEPPLLCFAARFGAPQTHNDIWNSWNGYSQDIAAALAGRTEMQSIPFDVFNGFLPKATAFRGVALPVFSLTGPDDLRERVTNVLVNADKELGS